MQRAWQRLWLFTMTCFVVALLVASCRPVAPTVGGAERTTLTIFAAASLTDAFSAIGTAFMDDYPGTTIVFNFAGSNQLATQIGEGAPADLFASADERQMAAAIASGRISSGTPRIFAYNRLVVVAPADNPAELSALADLATPGIKLVFAAAEVPVGQYTLNFLAQATAADTLGSGYGAAVMDNVVSYEANVRAVLTKVTLGEADAGVVYRSDVGDTDLVQIEIPDRFNTVVSYPIAPLTDTANPAVARRFVEYLLAPAGQQLLARHGFVTIRDTQQ